MQYIFDYLINLFGLENDSFIHYLLLDKLVHLKKRMNEMKEMSKIIIVLLSKGGRRRRLLISKAFLLIIFLGSFVNIENGFIFI